MLACVDKLKAVFSLHNGYKSIINDNDEKDLMLGHDIFSLQARCRLLSLALRNALEWMLSLTWKQYLSKAIDEINEVDDISYINNPEVLHQWHHRMRHNRESFANPQITRGKATLPPILHNNPDFFKEVLGFAKENLAELSGKAFYNYIYNVALPKLLRTRRKELRRSSFSMAELLQENHLSKLYIQTVYNWLHIIGFKYEVRKKTYYVDGHEKADVVRYRTNFCKRYLNHEIQMH